MSGEEAKTREEWVDFVLAHGWRARVRDLAFIVGRSEADITRLRNTAACTRLAKGKAFAELFSLWHGRAPTEQDWPAPVRHYNGCYEWQAPELALLASLVGRLDFEQLAHALSARLRQRTGDPKAARSPQAVQQRVNAIGLQSTDVLGGITVAQAGREVGSTTMVYQAIQGKKLRARRLGRLWVIPREEWAKWKATRTFPPQGFVQLSTLRAALGVRSDKLSEFARQNYVPSAIRCNPFGGDRRSTQFGTWWVAPAVAKRLLRDRAAGRLMPWHGKPNPDNLRSTFRLWQTRKHPSACAACAQIWGKRGAPRSFEEYVLRYPALAHGAKRHLTRPWAPGMTLDQVAAVAKRTRHLVRLALANGVLNGQRVGGRTYVSRTEATRWIARKCPSGESGRSWISLATACKQYLFTRGELRRFIKRGLVKSKIGCDGATRGVEYVSRNQCGRLRERSGFTETEAARRAGVSVQRLRELLKCVAWREASGIPLKTLQAIIKRLRARHGYTIEEVARRLRTSVAWIRARCRDGTIKVSRAKWDRRRINISAQMIARLEKAQRMPRRQRAARTADWLGLQGAAREAGVCTATIQHWAKAGELRRRRFGQWWRYHRAELRQRARVYWRRVRFHRAVAPEWIQHDRSGRTHLKDERRRAHLMYAG